MDRAAAKAASSGAATASVNAAQRAQAAFSVRPAAAHAPLRHHAPHAQQQHPQQQQRWHHPRLRGSLIAPRASSADDESLPEPRLGPNVAAGIKDVQQSLEWRTATVTRNDAANLNGGQRLLHLSVTDDVRLCIS